MSREFISLTEEKPDDDYPFIVDKAEIVRIVLRKDENESDDEAHPAYVFLRGVAEPIPVQQGYSFLLRAFGV
jgi:hypothetical protein